MQIKSILVKMELDLESDENINDKNLWDFIILIIHYNNLKI